ncbi:hypothetical protein ACROYT_G007188 [Oculina patagonica]
MLSDNPIQTIEPEAFKLGKSSSMVIKNRTIGMLKYHSRRRNCIIYLNPLNSDEEAIKVENPTWKTHVAYISALLASGFRRIPDNRTDYYKFLPCPLGTFANLSSRGTEGCIQCPPGGFYSDNVGHVAKSCKKCPNGSFVHFDKAPGKQSQDCKSCPEGTDTDFFAGYRACTCLEGFYRTDMFEKCHKCGQGGLKCQDDYASLKSGHWWEWRNETHKDRYRKYIRNLLTSSPALDAFSVQFPYPIPIPYKCPIKEACKGGLDSRCEKGYEGPFCDVCSSGYYKQLKTCKQCPSRKWMVRQLSIIAAVLLITIALLVWTSKRKTKKDEERSLMDMCFSRLKIVIGFYQLTHGILEAFSYIEWPDSLEVIGKYSEILQLNVLQIAPAHCLSSGLHLDAFGNLFLMMAINAAVTGVSCVVYEVRKVLILRSKSLNDEERSREISKTKELVYRNLFFFLYVTYLSTCSKTANVVPLACRKLCRDENEEMCQKYLRADYSVLCQGRKYNDLLIVAYISAAYIFALPAASFITLWRQRKVISSQRDAKTPQGQVSNMEMITALRFLFENYKAKSWYWEIVEMSRKVILTSGLILVGQESRSYIGMAWVIAGMHGMLFCWISPIQDVTENRLMSASLAVTVVNLGIGAVSRIPAENLPASADPYTEKVLFKMLVFGANGLVVGLLIVQYAVYFYRFFKEWRQNPHWSFSCCLALFLPLTDLQSELREMAGKNVLKHELQTGNFEIPTVRSTAKDSEATEVTLEEDDNTVIEVHVHEENGIDTDYNNTKCHKATQTELGTFASTGIEVREPVDKPQGKYL